MNPELKPNIRLRLLPDRAVLMIAGELTVHAVQPPLWDLAQAVSYYHYETVQFLVNSPGGEVNALFLMEQSIRWWRGQGIRIVTSAWRQAYSAAAMLVSMGDPGWRMARSGTSLLYHQGRFQFKEPATIGPAALEEMCREQSALLERFVKLLTEASGGQACGAAFPASSEWTPLRVNQGDAVEFAAAKKPAPPKLENYQDLILREAILTAEQAQAMKLVDHIVDGPRHEQAQWFDGLL